MRKPNILAEEFEAALEKVKAWAKLTGNDNLFALLNNDKSIEDYLVFAERTANSKLKESMTELDLEKKQSIPNKFMVRRLLDEIGTHNDTLNRIAEYKQYRNSVIRRRFTE